LCSGPNGCALAAGAGDVSACWCAAESVPAELLERVGPEAIDKSCVCRGCVRSHPPEASSVAARVGIIDKLVRHR
jgi:hypothetical protein